MTRKGARSDDASLVEPLDAPMNRRVSEGMVEGVVNPFQGNDKEEP